MPRLTGNIAYLDVLCTDVMIGTGTNEAVLKKMGYEERDLETLCNARKKPFSHGMTFKQLFTTCCKNAKPVQSGPMML